MADPLWLSDNNISSVKLNDSNGNSHEFDSLEAFGPNVQIFLVVLYSLTSLLAFSGNTLVIFVEFMGKRSALNLRKFLINLAISDILIGVFCVPFIYTDIMLGRWIFQPLLCPIAQFTYILSVFVTTYTLTAIAIERYFATLHPLSYSNVWLLSHCNHILLTGWAMGSILASVVVVHTKAVTFTYRNETLYDCRHDVDWDHHDIKIYILVSFILTFVLPMTFITISYGSIGHKLLQCPFLNDSNGNRSFDRRNAEFINKMKVFKMLVAVVILFFICWFPVKLFTILLNFWPNLDTIETVTEWNLYFGGYFVCHWLSMANSFVNPIIYCFMSKSFRMDLLDLIANFCDRLSSPTTRSTDVKPST